jgi:hypothetical protein
MTDFNEDQARQDKLEELYADDGRHDPDHPMHGLYTGLWEAYVNSMKETK